MVDSEVKHERPKLVFGGFVILAIFVGHALAWPGNVTNWPMVFAVGAVFSYLAGAAHGIVFGDVSGYGGKDDG